MMRATVRSFSFASTADSVASDIDHPPPGRATHQSPPRPAWRRRRLSSQQNTSVVKPRVNDPAQASGRRAVRTVDEAARLVVRGAGERARVAPAEAGTKTRTVLFATIRRFSIGEKAIDLAPEPFNRLPQRRVIGVAGARGARRRGRGLLTLAFSLPRIEATARGSEGRLPFRERRQLATVLDQRFLSDCSLRASRDSSSLRRRRLSSRSAPPLDASRSGARFAGRRRATGSRAGGLAPIGRQASRSTAFEWPPPSLTRLWPNA